MKGRSGKDMVSKIKKQKKKLQSFQETIINLQKDKILSTHYCGAMNRPVAELQSNKMGIIKFLTNQKLSGLDEKKELFVGSWELNLLPNDSEKFIYKYTAVAPNGGFTAIAEMNRIR